jgi:hypothetical protein
MAMSVPRHVGFAASAALVLLAACGEQMEPVPLYDGEWIDIASIGRERSETCVGTFEYVDAYAGVLAAEFGIDGPIGTYLWYTPEDFDALLPCPHPYPSACASGDTIHSSFLPDEHEMVHIAHHRRGSGPNALSEGIAVYYSTEISDGWRPDVAALSSRLAVPSGDIPIWEYEMLGRFAGFLIERYGLEAVLEVCVMAGDDASGAQLSAAMESVLAARGETPHDTSLGLSAQGFVAETGSTPGTAAFRLRALDENPGARSRDGFHHGLLGATANELILALSQEPAGCDDFEYYHSKVFACGVAAAAPTLGPFVDDHLSARIEFDCSKPGTVGPHEGGELYGQIVRTLSLDIPADGHYWFRPYDETQEDEPVPEGITLFVSQCAPCGDYARAPAEFVWDAPLLGDFEAGRYAVDVRMPEDYVGTVRLDIDRSWP